MKHHEKLSQIQKFFAFFFLTSLTSYSQINNLQPPPGNAHPTFSEQVQERSIQYDSLLTYMTESELADSIKSYKHFKVWQNFWNKRISPEGNILEYENSLKAVMSEADSHVENIEDWHELGPYNFPNNQQVSNIGGGEPGIGPVNWLSFAPNYSSTGLMFTGGWSTSLWYSEDYGDTWLNGGTDQLTASISTADCKASHLDEDVWFMITGNGDGEYYVGSGKERSNGMYRTINKGQTWEEIGTEVDFGGSTPPTPSGDQWQFYIYQLKEILLDPTSSAANLTAYVSGSFGVFKTTNAMASVGSGTSAINWQQVLELTDVPASIQVSGTTYTRDDSDISPYQTGYLDAYDIMYGYTSTGLIDVNQLYVTCRSKYINGSAEKYRCWILKSDDGGTNWETIGADQLPTGYDELKRLAIRISPDKPGILYVHGNVEGTLDEDNLGNGDGRLLQFNLNTNDWILNEELVNIWYDHEDAFDVSPTDGDDVSLTRSIRFRRSIDGGSTFTTFNSNGNYHVDIEDIKYSPDGSKIWLATHGGPFVYDIATQSFSDKMEGIGNAEILGFSSSDINGDRMVIGLYHDGSMKGEGVIAEDWAPNWKVIGGGDGQRTLIEPLDPDVSYISSQGSSHRRNTDFWSSTSSLNVNPPSIGDEGYIWDTDIKADPFVPTAIYIAKTNVKRHPYRGITSEGSWQQLSDMSLLVHPSPPDQDWVDPQQYRKGWPSETNENLFFGQFVSDGNPGKPSIWLNNAISMGETVAQSSWVPIPRPADAFNPNGQYWVDRIKSDPDNSNIFYVVYKTGGANEPNTHKIVKYTYNGNGTGNIDITADTPTQILTNGFTTEDLTFDFPKLAAFDLEIIPGSREFFLSTDLGVYYTTEEIMNSSVPEDDVWQLYGTLLPNVAIENMELLYNFNKVRVGTHGRGVWENELPCTALEGEKEITEDTEWNSIKRFRNSIRVTNEATLTITAKVFFVSETKLIIDPGAEVIVDGGHLTTSCGDTWQGIEVWGNTSATQTPSNQGVLKVINGALIENARNAVTLWKPDDWTKTGGIVQASNSTFLNNRRSVEFMSYQNEQVNGVIASNRSYFRNCTFETNNDCIIPEDEMWNMITMWRVSGVGIWGCEFKNDRGVSSAEYLRGAIESSDSNFRVDNYCDGIQQIGQPCPVASTTHSTFTGFNKAIHARGAEQNVGPTIKNAVFDKNMIGIEFDAVIAPLATFNDFTVGNNDFAAQDPTSPLYHLGIHTNNCDEYILEENTIEGDDVNGYTTHGIYVYDNSYSANSNQIYKNSYEDVSSATIASGIHANPSPTMSSIGLKYLCNINQNNTNDFEVREFDGGDYSEISNYQNGPSGTNAGNEFSTGMVGDGIYTHMDFYSDANYIYFKGTGGTDPDEDEIIISSPGSIALASINSSNSCTTNFPVGDGQIDVGFQLGKFSNNKDEFNNLYYTYLQLLDEGNTDGMIMEIDLTWPEDAWDLHAELMSRSPYNSESVLMAAADKNVLTHGMLLEILLANPDALRSGSVINHVENNLSNPLPAYMIDILYLAARNPQTVRTEMERNLSSLHQEVVSSHKHLVNHYLNDTINDLHPDTLINWFSQIRNLSGRYQQIFAYTGVNQYANAFAVIDSIETNYKLSNEQHQELTNAEDFLSYLENLHTDGRNVAQITPSELPELERIANVVPGGIAAERAENILCFHYNICANESGAPKNNGTKIRKPKVTLEEALDEGNRVKVAPNPADSYIEFEYEILLSGQENTLRIIDTQGRPVQVWNLGEAAKGIKVLDTRRLPNGVYFFELVQDNEKIKGGKFIVQH